MSANIPLRLRGESVAGQTAQGVRQNSTVTNLAGVLPTFVSVCV
jgi:hypothetical protein